MRISRTEYSRQNIHDMGISRTGGYPGHGDIQDRRGQEDIQDNVNNYVSFLVFKRSTMPLMLIYLNIDIDKFDKYVFKYLREKIRHVK